MLQKEREKEKFNVEFKEKDLLIYELRTNIDQIEKSKNYLQAQTDEILKSIEPKDLMIEKQKEQNSKLELEL